ncbi:hypothetical protein B7463_g12628, partial [Scytalidium lignicola]
MKVRQRTVCHTCRAKKLGCDGKQPACSQCLLTGKRCGGYQHDLIFVQCSLKRRAVSHARFKEPEKTSIGELDINTYRARNTDSSSLSNKEMTVDCLTTMSSRLNRTSIDELTALVVWHYTPECELSWLSSVWSTSRPRICGAWVEVLPSITGLGCHEPLLSSAIKALAVSIRNKGQGESAWKSDSIEAYGSALRSLNKGLRVITNTPSHELVAAIMCLTLAELMIPSSESAWNAHAHVRGVSELLRISGPEIYASGILHKLFVGFRPIMIFEAFRSRRSTFLALDEWKVIPFHLHPPSSMQSLLSEAVTLPAALQNSDRLEILPLDKANVLAHEALLLFFDVLRRLKRWNESFRKEMHGPLHWPNSTSTSKSSQPTSVLICSPTFWFPSISVANTLTHFWAFQIICLVHIHKLESSYASLDNERFVMETEVPVRSLKDNSIELATRICQSMKYMMQNDMKLYGSTSTWFPLSAAYDIFKYYGKETEEQLAWCRGIIAQLVQSGLYITPMFSRSG